NLIAARPGPGRTRVTLYNAHLIVRHVSGDVDRRMLAAPAEYRDVLRDTFGLELSDAEVAQGLETVERRGSGRPHPFFAGGDQGVLSSPGLTGRSSIPGTSVIESIGRGVPDHPLSRVMTAGA